ASAAGGLKNRTSNGDFSPALRTSTSVESLASGLSTVPWFESLQSTRMFWAFRTESLFWTSPTTCSTWNPESRVSVQSERFVLTIWTKGGVVPPALAGEDRVGTVLASAKPEVEKGRARPSAVSA